MRLAIVTHVPGGIHTEGRHMLFSLVQRNGGHEFVIGFTASDNTAEMTLTMSRDEAESLQRRLSEILSIGGARPAFINVQPL